MPEVSVIIPNYNHARFLKQRVDSVLAQTFQDIEIIILDDCSTDSSREIIELYRNHSKVTSIIYNQLNSGSPFKQWKKGIELAQGEYIWIAESDDWCEPTFLETLMHGVTGSTALAFAQSIVIENSNKILWNTKSSLLEQKIDGSAFIEKEMLTRNSIINASMCIFRKECFLKVDPGFTTFKFCGDWLFWILIAKQGDIFISGKMLNYFRKHDSDVSGMAFQSGLFYREYFQLAEKLEDVNLITADKRQLALLVVMDRFLRDRFIETSIKRELLKEFQNRLGNTTYYKKIIHYKIFRLKKKWKGLA